MYPTQAFVNIPQLETLHTTVLIVIHLTFFPIWEREGPINCFTQDLYFPSIHFLYPSRHWSIKMHNNHLIGSATYIAHL